MSRILIVDDDKKIRTLLTKGLERAGFHVDTAATGKEGIEKVAVENYAVVLMDLRMPNLDGRTAIKAIEAGRPGVRIFVLSGLDDPALRESIQSSHPSVAGWIPKPFQIQEVVDRVRAALGGR
ncbi:MAG: response regulator [Planctomycetes bacterium]|nr:response regulator [Planctomycetota bacterium]